MERDFRIEAEIIDFEKQAEEMRMAWGWAYVCEIDGEQVVDHSGQACEWLEMQKCAHEFGLSAGIGGEMHEKAAGRIVEQLFFTPYLKQVLACEHLPTGWFIGFKIFDPQAWEKVKNGTYRMFSIEGRAEIEEVAA